MSPSGVYQIDFWRVEAYEPDHLLRLLAEMKVPGRAWLQFEVESVEGGTRIRQTAIYEPVGLLGLAYWYVLYPIHQLVFRGMLHGVARAIPKSQRSECWSIYLLRNVQQRRQLRRGRPHLAG